MTNQPPSRLDTDNLIGCSPYLTYLEHRSETHAPTLLNHHGNIASSYVGSISALKTKRALSDPTNTLTPPKKKLRTQSQSDNHKISVLVPRVIKSTVMPGGFKTLMHPNLVTQHTHQTLQGLGLRRKQCALSSSSTDKETEKKEQLKPLSPAQFVRQLLGNKLDRNNDNYRHEAIFTKPTKEELAAYTQDVVCAVRSRDLETLRSLHASGRRLHCSNRFGESLLHMACRRGYNDVVGFLMEDTGVPVRIKDDFGRTPLHDACWTPQPNYDLVRILLRKDPTLALVADVRGHTRFDYVRKEHWAEWTKFLEENSSWLSTTEGDKPCQKQC